MLDFDEIEDVYKKVSDKIPKQEFISKIEEKLDMLSGLCDSKTAAMLVLKELGFDDIKKIKDITSDTENVVIIANVVSIGDVREFKRSDKSVGYVVNLTLADETGTIIAALWDQMSDLIKIGDIKIGDNIKLRGYVKQGQRGLEIHVGNKGDIEHINEKIKVKINFQKISDIKPEMSGLNIIGKIVDIGKIHTFNRKDGTIGKVRNITIGDETGKIRFTLWDKKAESLGFDIGDVIEIKNAYSRENNFTGDTEIQISYNTSISKSSKEIDYSENYTHISDIGVNSAYSIKGNVTGIDEIREFERSDGTKSKVSTIYVSDKTGRIRVVLWDNKTDILNKIDLGTEISIIDGYAKLGLNDKIELNVGSRTIVKVLEKH